MLTEKETYSKDLSIAGNLQKETELLLKEASTEEYTIQTVFLTIFCC